jgi:hypothetical protein
MRLAKYILFSLPILITHFFINITSWILIIGIIGGSLANWLWWHAGFVGSKYDRGLEVIEHFHHAIWLVTLSPSSPRLT